MWKMAAQVDFFASVFISVSEAIRCLKIGTNVFKLTYLGCAIRFLFIADASVKNLEKGFYF